ncbi:hypothetical protein ACSQ6I_07960 [Anabaena sp. WFMT]|uniref:hypothetical protein n=1 Tax=Anabaena sp. WFMT TaxID=3449730 RepID=UPI003F1F8B6D
MSVLRKIRIGKTEIITNHKFGREEITLFTLYGREKINEFLLKTSRHFRDVFSISWEKYQTDAKRYYHSSFLKKMNQAKSFKKFLLAFCLQQMLQKENFKMPFEEFYLPMLIEGHDNYQTNRETGAQGLVVGILVHLAAIYPKYKECLFELNHSLDIIENINSGRVIYLDANLALTYNQDIKNEGLGELLCGAKKISEIWTYDKTDLFVPLNSLRKAKKALADYKGIPRKGELMGNDSERFAKFLGLEIKDKYAYMPKYQDIKQFSGKGFKK